MGDGSLTKKARNEALQLLNAHAKEKQKLNKSLEHEKNKHDVELQERVKQRAELKKQLMSQRSTSVPDLTDPYRPDSRLVETPCPNCGTRVMTPAPPEGGGDDQDLPNIVETPDGIKIIGKNGKAVNIHINVSNKDGKKAAQTKSSLEMVSPDKYKLHGTGKKKVTKQMSVENKDKKRGSKGGDRKTSSAPSNERARTATLSRVSSDLDRACVFCGRRDKDFNEHSLEEHYWSECPMLARCVHCGMVQEIANYTEHLLSQCEMSNVYKECPRCHAAVMKEIFARHTQPASCPKVGEGSGNTHAICPLCNKLVAAGDEGWRAHIMESGGCPSNPRYVPHTTSSLSSTSSTSVSR